MDKIEQINEEKNRTDLVSIIVPVYKCEAFIEKCIQSISNQSYKNLEVILVLDGEFDKSGDICKKMASKDSRIKIISKKNEGVSIARNKGIEVSNGNWIAFIDSDDWIEKNYIETLLYEAKKENADIAICSYYTEYNDYTIKDGFFIFRYHYFEQKNIDAVIESCLIKNSISKPNSTTNVGVPWAKLYNADFVRKHELRFVPGLKRMQDTIFNLYAFSKADKVVYKDNGLYHYTKNERAATSKYSPDLHETWCFFINEVKKYIKKTNKIFLYNALDKKILSSVLEIIDLEILPQVEKIGRYRCIKLLYKIIYQKPFINAIYDTKISQMTGKGKLFLILLKLKLLFPVLWYTEYKIRTERKTLIRSILF